MGTEAINYEAVLADLEAKRAEIDRAISTIRAVSGIQASGNGGGTPGPLGGGGKPAPDAYLGMSIPEATKKHLQAARTKVPIRDLMAALEAGGLPPTKYNTMYSVLRRRENDVGDIINLNGDWALSEWYPNHQRKAKAKADDKKDDKKPEDKKDEEKDAPQPKAKAAG